MSPEQVRGPQHLLDGRSDIFSLGIVFYELLTRQRPFRGDIRELLRQITTSDPVSPRRIDASIPKELERICLKALKKQVSQRYRTAKDMADDLWHWACSQERVDTGWQQIQRFFKSIASILTLRR